MEIRNIKLLTQDMGKFQIPAEKEQGRDIPRASQDTQLLF